MKKEYVMVNKDKENRAKEIIGLITGKLVARTDEEQDRKTRFMQHLSAVSVDPESPEAVQFVYEKLGGLLRTPEEHERANEEAAEMKTKPKVDNEVRNADDKKHHR